MEGIKPIPTGYTFIIVFAYPFQCFNILLTDAVFELEKLLGLNSKFF
jgi:hypothetical protein